jgi:isopentenyl-diphosphate delta-isomerase type 1
MPFDDQAELFYWVDENDEVLGSIPRKVAHSDRSKIHRAAGVLVFNQGKLLLQKRSMHKDTNPGCWSLSASGHLTFGQSYEEAARRELEEELGIKEEIEFLGKQLFDFEIEQEYFAVYKAEYGETPTHFDRSEVEEVRWVEVEKLAEFMRDNKVSKAAQLVLGFAGIIKKESML